MDKNMAYKKYIDKAFDIRKRFIELFSNLGFGHITSAFSLTEIMVTLYYEIMNYEIDDPQWLERDRLVISKGHGAGILFPIYEDIGFITTKELNDVLKIGGDYGVLQKYFYPGFDFYGGSLGMGLGMAAGLAHSAKLDNKNYLTFCILGDAECYEGSVWEAAMYSSHNKLSNLISIIDRNKIGSSSFTEQMVKLEPLGEKWKSCGWEVKKVDGHSFKELFKIFSEIRNRKFLSPLCIIADTIKGKGLEYMYDKPFLHGYMPTGDEAVKAIKELQRGKE